VQLDQYANPEHIFTQTEYAYFLLTPTAGIRTDFLEFTVDRNPYQHGRFLPGTHFPIYPPERIRECRPDYILILPWNLRDEIVTQLAYAREWGAKFYRARPGGAGPGLRLFDQKRIAKLEKQL